ncbi:MarR family winged helix-turn-helix transcriptional regulator [Porphyrobacter sp. AAP82]|uniref:MarR family winged helix-turn-helix transcriptional regulator n=1 Tax=Porphyrobacter sp. AAP82 TaxID=1248917 RepID=UPI000304E2FF|nr:MarR family transcriptional regulator [Porphyrobacter sp. AAP82]
MKLVPSPHGDSPVLTPLDALTFRLEDLPRQLRRIIDDALQDEGLSRTQWRLLGYVLRQEGLTQTEIARLLEVERASVGVAIDGLEKRGLIERAQHATDRRVWRIIPTPAAKALLGGLREVIDEVYAQLFNGFSDNELAKLGQFFERMARNIKA